MVVGEVEKMIALVVDLDFELLGGSLDCVLRGKQVLGFVLGQKIGIEGIDKELESLEDISSGELLRLRKISELGHLEDEESIWNEVFSDLLHFFWIE